MPQSYFERDFTQSNGNETALFQYICYSDDTSPSNKKQSADDVVKHLFLFLLHVFWLRLKTLLMNEMTWNIWACPDHNGFLMDSKFKLETSNQFTAFTPVVKWEVRVPKSVYTNWQESSIHYINTTYWRTCRVGAEKSLRWFTASVSFSLLRVWCTLSVHFAAFSHSSFSIQHFVRSVLNHREVSLFLLHSARAGPTLPKLSCHELFWHFGQDFMLYLLAVSPS